MSNTKQAVSKQPQKIKVLDVCRHEHLGIVVIVGVHTEGREFRCQTKNGLRLLSALLLSQPLMTLQEFVCELDKAYEERMRKVPASGR